MSEVVKIDDHYTEGKELLPSQFYEKNYINSHLKALLDSCQDVEESFYNDLYINKFLLNATGSDLEVIASLYKINRILGEGDTELRFRIASEISRRNAEGTPNSVKKVMSSGTSLTNMRIFEHSVGCVVLYGETSNNDYALIGTEAQYTKEACPITTGSTVFGVSYSNDYNTTLIPAEIDVSYYNLIADDLGELKNVVTGTAVESKNIVVRSTLDFSASTDSKNAQLAEFSKTTSDFLMNTNSTETGMLALNGDINNTLQVEVEGIENTVGVPIDSVQQTINSTVGQIQDAFNQTPP